MNKTINTQVKLPNPKTNKEWTAYLAVSYAEGFEEGENAKEEEIIEAWAVIIKTKIYLSLQGYFGRTAMEYIKQGIIKESGAINWTKS